MRSSTRWFRVATAGVLLATLVWPAVSSAVSASQKKQLALEQFAAAERMRNELNALPGGERSVRDYQRVAQAYRRVYYTDPASSKADSAAFAAAELLAEAGRRFNDPKALQAAITQYEFLRREYPGSRYRVDALFTIAQIYHRELKDYEQAKATYQEYVKRYPVSGKLKQAQNAIAELEPSPEMPKPAEARAAETSKAERLSRITGVRHWSTPDYTRVAIDLEGSVRYEQGRVPNPDRIFFDLYDSTLAAGLAGKSYEISDGFLRRIRVAQFQPGLVRVVLEIQDVADYSAFLLPNPYRLMVDIHGRPGARALTAKNEAANVPEQKPARLGGKVADGSTTPVKADVQLPRRAPELAKESANADPSRRSATPASLARDDKTGSAKSASLARDDKSDKVQMAQLNDPMPKAAAKVGSAPKGGAAPRETALKPESAKAVHAARPTSDGDTSLIRALGLKIGRIVVDAGHGGHDTGTIGPKGLQEKDLVLDVALRLGKLLESKLGASVVYTRKDDTFIPLETRTAIANQNRADLFISIHANSSGDRAARGVETYYLNFTSDRSALEVAARENAVSDTSIHELQDLVKKIALKEKIEESREFATDIQHALWAGEAAKSPAIRNRGVKKAPFIVLIGANMPSILAEISFLSNPSDEKRLRTPEYRQKIAEYLYRGITQYAGGLSGVKVAQKTGAAGQ